jgi:DNA mismatch repair protein MutL
MIKVLPEKVINQIAAGEVIERPSSVVKELIDNSIDANATKISVNLVAGGQSLISVADNGSGMSRDDALLSFERHATSKLTSFEDLSGIVTNGFRGEALPSIASVSKVSMVTKVDTDEVGTLLEMQGGKILSVKPHASSTGTTIEIRSLFFNVPARKKFLKSARSDEVKCRELICAYALAYPHIDFTLSIDGILQLSFSSEQDVQKRAAKIIRGGTVAVSSQYDEISIHGLLGHPSQAVSDGASLTILVNKRFVSDRFILRGVKEGFSSTLKEREFPVGMLSIELPGEFVDVNVHPQKSEVRFSNPQKVFAAVKIAVEEAIRSFRTPLGFEVTQGYQKTTSIPEPYVQSDYSKELKPSTFNGDVVAESIRIDNPRSLFSQEVFQAPRFNDWRFLGQIFECYLLFDFQSRFYIVDMHAAHERLNYNKIRSLMSEKEKKTQVLLIPQQIPLSQQEILELEKVSTLLYDLGYRWQQHRDGIELLEVPSILFSIDQGQLIRKITAEETYGEFPFALEETIAYICARLACHASVRSGRILGREEAYALLEQMESADFATACPHGRPCVVEFQESDVEKWFGRDR